MSENATLTVISGFGGTVEPNGTVEVFVGQQYLFMAKPSRGCSFQQWIFNGTARWTTNPLVLTITEAGSYELEAQFSGPLPPIPSSGQGVIHVNPLNLQENNGIVKVSSEILILYPEGSPEFDYLMALIPRWEYYVSALVTVPNTLAIIDLDTYADPWIQTGRLKTEGVELKAYFYGYYPNNSNYSGCVAIVQAISPELTVSACATAKVKIHVAGNLTFSGDALAEN